VCRARGAWGYLRFDALNLYYVHGRWYNPDTGLFLSPDENGEYRYGSGQDAVNWAWFAWGFNCQFYSDITLGLYEYQQPLSIYKCQDFSGAEFYIGRLVGRASSELLAYLEMYVGGTTFVGSGGLALISGGTLVHVSAPAMVGGAALTAHGVTVLLRNTLTPIAFAKKAGGAPNYTARNFADNLRKIKPKPSPSHQAHHMLPQAFEDFFRSKGINIHDPRWGAWWDVPEHTQKWRAFNDEWEVWIDTKGNHATIQDIIQKATELARKYNLDWP